jgi:phosphatidate cytidylyltransferase
MLKQRILTALLLFAGLMVALFLLPSLYFAILMSVVSAIAAWEWGALAGLKQRGRLVFGGGVLVLAQILFFYNLQLFPPVFIFWCLVLPFWLWQRWNLSATQWGRALLLALGVLLILAAMQAFVFMQKGNPWVCLAILGIAWVSDISAYFAGRKFGGKKLAPNISPGKTWAGVWGALVGVLVYALLLIAVLWFRDASITKASQMLAVFPLLALILAVLGILGDLFESLLKRQAGIKDSSNILPGHGGVLDRIDSLMAILPCAIILGMLAVAMTIGV